MKWLPRALVALVACYLVLFGTVTAAMLQTPERFGAFMKHMPPAIVWGGLPASRMWLWARRGALKDRGQRVGLSSYRGQRPVVLVFGSYT